MIQLEAQHLTNKVSKFFIGSAVISSLLVTVVALANNTRTPVVQGTHLPASFFSSVFCRAFSASRPPLARFPQGAGRGAL